MAQQQQLRDGLVLKRLQDGLEISGRTYDWRETLKALGGKWNPQNKTWVLPLDADLSSLAPPPPPPISAAMRRQMEDYYISDAYLRRVSGRTRHGRCCSEAETKLDDFNPQGPMWYVCKKHGNYKSDYDGT